MILPAAVLHQHIAVLGKTRSGKSSVMRGIVEHLLTDQKPVCIIDPKGDWWGLKVSKDGKRAGFPVVIFGGEHGDVTLNEHAGAQVAELFATGNRPCLIDLGGWTTGARTRFFIDFAGALFKHTKGNRWLVIDEVHNFAPKGKIQDPQAGMMLHWVNRLASEGLGKGLAMIFASQRPQKVHNDTLTSAETLIAMRVLHPSDREAVSEWIKGCGNAKGDDVLKSLANLRRGQGWAWSPEAGLGPVLLDFPMFKTYDSFRPQTVEDTKALKGWAAVDLEEVNEKLGALIEEAKENDPKKLKADVARLTQALSMATGGQQALAQQRPSTVEVSVLNDADRVSLEAVRSALDRIDVLYRGREDTLYAQLAGKAQKLSDDFLKRFEEFHGDMLSDLEKVYVGKAFAKVLEKLSIVQTLGVGLVTPPRSGTRSAASPAPVTTPKPRDIPVPGSSAIETTLQRSLLTTLAMHPNGLTKAQMLLFAGYAASGKTSGAFAAFMERGWMVQTSRGTFELTAAGASALGNDYPQLPVGADLRAHILNEQCNDMERALLQVIIQHYPDPITKAEIHRLASYAASGKTSGAFARFVRVGWAVGNRGTLVASDDLFGVAP